MDESIKLPDPPDPDTFKLKLVEAMGTGDLKQVQKTIEAEEVRLAKPKPVSFQHYMLGAIQHMRNVYADTVPTAIVQERRAKNRTAKASRKINRKKK